MKLKIAKIFFLVFCIAAFIFLLLPFLKTTPPPTPAQLKAQPQVATDNPLTAIAKRLAHLFGPRKERRTQKISASATQPRDAFALEQEPFALAQFSVPLPPNSTDPTDWYTPPAKEREDYLDEVANEPWVLIQQVAPDTGQPGMHEVNVHENPYDRYVKQERALQTLAGPQPVQREAAIPDSKWARLIRPVKQFFGLDTPSPVGNSPVTIHTGVEHAYYLSDTPRFTTDVKQASFGPERLPFPDITPQEWARMTPFEREQKAKERFTELISGTRGLREAAEILAAAKYPNAKNGKMEQEKQAFQNGLHQQSQNLMKEGILQVMQERAKGKEPVDELAYTLGCKNTSLPDDSGVCMNSRNGEPSAVPPTPADIIAQEQLLNADMFYQTTRYVFPKGLPVTPVLGPTTLEAISMMGGPAESTQQAAEIYQFLYGQQRCAEQTCYWVANAKQSDSQLSDALVMANATPKFDPLNVYAPLKEPFVQWKIKQLGENATEEQIEQVRKEAEKQFDQHAPNFVAYTVEQAQQAKGTTTYYVTDPPQAAKFSNDIDSVAIAYGKAPLTQAKSAEEAGRLISQSFAQNVRDNEQVRRSIQRPMYQQTVRENVRQQKSAAKKKQNSKGGNKSVPPGSKK